MSGFAWTVTGYLTIAGLIASALLVSWLRPTRLARVGEVLTWAMRRRSTQFGLLLAWWWLGWHFLTSR